MDQPCSQRKEKEKTMRKQIRRPLSIVVVSLLLVALAAGAALAAVVSCVPGATACSGTTQDDYIKGTQGVDNISASFGKDEVWAEGGADIARGGPGQDKLIGDSDIDSSTNNDRIYGNSGDDVLTGEAGSDYLNGGGDDDTIHAQGAYLERKDTVLGETGDDTIYAHDGIVDSIDCGDGFDEVDYDRDIDVVAANCEDRSPHHSSVVADFSASENPRGVWTYGYKASDGSNFNPYTKADTPYVLGLLRWSSGSSPEPMVAYNSTGQPLSYLTINHPPDVLNLHPGSTGQKSVVRWTAPSSGTVTIQGRFEGIDTQGTTTNVAVVHNSTTLFSRNINGYGARAPFLITKAVAAGDTIDFSVGRGINGTYYNDSTGLSATMMPTS
jgi:Ca2+-binding RTX toxin-like protein